MIPVTVYSIHPLVRQLLTKNQLLQIKTTSRQSSINKTSAPPIYIFNFTNFSAFTKELIRITRPNAFTCKSTTSFLIVHAKGAKNYNTIINHLRDTGAYFHTYQPSIYRSFRVVIKNLHHFTLCMEISNALSREEHTVKQIINVKNKNKRGLLLIFVDLNRHDNNNDIFNITSLLNTIV
uniref:Nucleic-acid-binding protein n=1 Tax=Sipha flava TaxID=143950 RepID=A0A2S2Q6Y6_9HEMI